MKNNVIAKVALSNDKKNKTRSFLIMVAVFLTTMLLTILCTYANGINKSNRANAGMQYGHFYGAWQSLDQEQLQEMGRRGEFSEIGTMAMAGLLQGNTTGREKVDASMVTADDTSLSLTNLDREIKEGHFPEKENEIAAQPDFFESMGYSDINVGDQVTLPYRANLQQTYQDKKFVVSGLIEEQKNGLKQKSYRVYCSKAFYETEFPEEQRRYIAYFTLKDSVEMNTDNAGDVINDLAGQCGVDEKKVSINNYYLIWKLDPGYETISICGMIAVCVILFSVVVIYNIFQVGMVQKIQEYGKIKELGATDRQMRKLIYREGIYLSIPSIPAGLIAGYLVSVLSFRWLMEQGNEVSHGAEMIQVSLFSPAMLLLSALLAFVTVVMSLRKPMKVVAAVSPVEAVRYQESTSGKKGGLRKGKKEVSVFSLAMANITGNRKRTLTTIFTMGLSCVLFVIIANWTGNIDEEFAARENVKHGQFQIELDYSMTDKAYPENNLDSILKDNPLNQELMEEIKALDGVTEIQSKKLYIIEINGMSDTVSVLNREDFEKEAGQGSGRGNLDYDKVSKENGIIYGWDNFMENEGYSLEQPVTMEISGGTDYVKYSGKIAGTFGNADTGWVITEDTWKKLGLSEEAIGWIWVDCKQKDVPAVQKALDELLQGKEHIEMSSFEEAMDLSRMSSKLMKAACYLFLGIIGLIGFMNLANTMIINIITKKQEYGILQAVGMTNAQLNRSLQLQGILFTAGTVFVALAAGLPAGYGLFVYAKSHGFFGLNGYHVPVVEIVIMVAAVAVLQLVLSFILSRNLKKESLVERIRYQG